jgi:cyclic-di-GMP-binding protein
LAQEVKMPSLDVVSMVDLQSLDNAVNNVKREVSTRFDFRSVKSEITLDKKEKSIHLVSGDEWKLKTISDMLVGQCVRLKVDPKSLEFSDIETVSTTVAKRDVKIKEGISKETSQKIVKYIKGLDLKVQPAIQDNKVRVTGKKIDDLQEIMRLLREQNFDVPLQFINMKS